MDTTMRITSKLALIAVVPLAAFCFQGWQNMRTSLEDRQIVKEMGANLVLVRACSDVVADLQRERGKTVLFRSGGIAADALDAQRAQTDKKIDPFLSSLGKARIDDSARKNASTVKRRLDEIRRGAAGRTPDQIRDDYTALIATALNCESAVANARTTKGLGKQLSSLVLVETAKENAGQLRATLSGILARNKPISRDDLSLLMALKSNVDVNLASPALVLNGKSVELLSALRKSPHRAQVDGVFTTVMGKWETGDYGVEGKVFFDTITRVIDDIGGIVPSEIEGIAGKLAKISTESGRNFAFSMAVLVVAAFLSIGTAVYFSRGIVRQLGGEPQEVIETVRRIGGGDFTVSIQTRTADTDSLLYNIRSLRDNLHSLLTEIRVTAEQTAASSEELSATAQCISTGSQQQASAVEQISASVETLSATIQSVAGNAKDASGVADEAKSAASKGGVTVEKSTEGMKLINDSSEKISKIIGVISQIASQTNLLALNAAIEAASAGEHGLGFAVVADEVRKLAERSSQAAEEITQLIKESTARVNDGSRLSNEVGASLSEILGGIEKTVAAMTSIRSATAEQAATASEVAKGMESISAVTEQNSASSEEMSASSEELAAQAQKLQELVSRFKLDEESRRPPAAQAAAHAAPCRPPPPPSRQALKAPGRPALAAAEPRKTSAGALYHD